MKKAGSAAMLPAVVLAGIIVAVACGGVTIPPCILDGTCLPTPKPTPTPTPVPTPTPTPTPIPTPRPTPPPSAGGDIAQGVQWSVVGAAWPSPDRPAPMFSDRIDGIMADLTGCAINSDCRTGMTMCQFHTTVIGRLRAESLFAGWQDGVCANDEIAVGLRPDLVQGYHIYNEGGGKVVWSTGANWEIGKGAYRDTWKAFDTDPTPPPEEPPVASCPPVTNLKMDVKHLASLVVDVTPRGPDCARCASIGKLCDNGVCPLGPEGPNPEDNAQRIACETAAGPYRFTLNGQPCDAAGVPCFHQSDNPLSIKVQASGLVAVTAANGVGNQVTVTVP